MQPDPRPADGLSDARRALLKGYLRGGMALRNPAATVIPKRTGAGPAPLSYGQQQIWVHSQFAGKSLIYNEPVTIHRYGELDVAALERCFVEIVRRHEAWRTTFEWKGDHPVQVVQPPPSRIEIPFTDLRPLPEAQREREAIRLATEDAVQPFDLARGPMYRPRLVRMGDAEHRLFLTLHHIIFDGVSLYRVFLPELQALYDAFTRNEPAILGDLPIQYPDYAVWHRELIERVLPKELPYWKSVLENLPVLDLGTDHPRPPVQTYAGEMETLHISAPVTGALKAVSKENGVTLFMTVVAAFKTLLYGYTGQEDIAVGSVSDIRTHTETQGLLGFFLNTMVIRSRVSGDVLFTDLLARVKNATLGALSHSAIPFELLVNELEHERNPSRSPLFQVLISVEPPLTPMKDGWAFTQMDVETGTAKFDLHLELDDRAEGLIGRFIYNTALFERETIQALKSRWLMLLDQIAAAPARNVRDLTDAVWQRPQVEPSEVPPEEHRAPAFTPPGVEPTPETVSLREPIKRIARQKRGVRFPGLSGADTEDAFVFPASIAQQRLWSFGQSDPGGFSHNAPAVISLRGPLNVPVLERAITEIVRRHDILRTTFDDVQGQPVQVVWPAKPLTLLVIDLRLLGPKERQAEARRLMNEDAEAPFDLERGPLFRTSLLCLGEREHVLLINSHRILIDASSRAIFLREMTALYEAFNSGQPSPLPELPIQFADFAEWQRRALQGGDIEKQLAYWKDRLRDLPVLQLPADRPQPAAGGYHGATIGFRLSNALAEDLRSLGKRHGVKLFVTLLAAFKALLTRYTAQGDIAVASPVANRDRPELENLIGFFLNILVLRTDLNDDPRFSDLLVRERETVEGAFENRDLPFEALIDELHPERIPPLSQVMLVVLPAPRFEQPMADLTLSTSIEPDKRTAGLDLTLTFIERPDGIDGSLNYNSDRFDADRMERMAGHLAVLLEGIVANPDARVSRLPLLTESERHRLLVEWNRTETPFPKEKPVHILFEEQVERTPGKIAVAFKDEQLTYRELDQRANQLARYLQGIGVHHDTLVAVLLDRSVDMVVGLLAVLKAGGAYVPLDPSDPGERLGMMLADCQVPVLLTASKQVHDFSHAAKIVCVDDEQIRRQIDGPLHLKGRGEDLAYVMYTSGSTGKPKAVAITHQAITRLVINANYLKFESSDVVAQSSNCSFDAATLEIWGALLHGARLEILEKDLLLSPDLFATEVAARAITTMFLTTAVFNQFARIIPAAFGQFRNLLFGGEAGDPAAVAKLFAAGSPPRRLVNGYGPTETTTFACWYLLAGTPEPGRVLPIGRPLSNTRIYLLDAHLAPVPIGIPGEIHVGGPGVARGYINRPDLTAERFVRDPFSPDPAARLYKTGDIGCYRADGVIDFLGRRDEQVKIRGFRVEPGEIEAALRLHPAVADCVVVARQESPGTKRLDAYFIPKHEVKTRELREFLATKLPAYMVPAALVPLESFPLTSNGKVDRNALPAPDSSLAVPEDAYVPPQGWLQLHLVEIWEELLGVRPIGIRDNFFERGGHSLLAVRMCARVEKVIGRRLAPAVLFECATIERLSRVLSRQIVLERHSPLIKVQPEGSKPPFFYLHGDFQDGGLYCINLARHLAKDRPFYAIDPHGVDGRPSPMTIEEMAASRLELLLETQKEGPYFIGGYCNGALVAFEMARQLEAQGRKVACVILVLADATNLQFKPVLTAATLWATLRRLDERKTQQLFLRWRTNCIFANAAFHYHLSALRAAFGMSRTRGLALTKRKSGRIFEQVVKMLRPRRGIGSPAGTPSKSPSGPAESDISRTYAEVVHSYMPRRYGGRVFLLRETELHAGWSLHKRRQIEGTEPNFGWDKVAKNLTVRIVPGDHFTAITVNSNLAVLAERLETCLDEAESELRSSR